MSKHNITITYEVDLTFAEEARLEKREMQASLDFWFDRLKLKDMGAKRIETPWLTWGQYGP